MSAHPVDVLVVGGGMAGAMAALAARAAGKTVLLAERAPGGTALSSGAVDVAAAAGEPINTRRSPLDAAKRLAARKPSHPYAVVGERLALLPEALAFAARELSLLAPPLPRPRFLASAAGSVHATALCQQTMAEGDLALGGTLAVIGLRGHLDFDAALVAGGIGAFEKDGGPKAIAVTADLFMRADEALYRPHELARALELPGAAEEMGQHVRRALPAGVRAALFPPILGLALHSDVPRRLAAALGIPVAEVLAGVPSVPGLRLQAALDARLAESGVEVVRGAVTEGRGPGQVALAGGREILAEAWVLASGRYLGGGIAKRDQTAETVLGLPVIAGGEPARSRTPGSLTARDSRSDQPLLEAGVAFDGLLRPLDSAGRPAHERLFGAGAVLAGWEPPADGSGLGCSLFTGWLAGRAAAGVG